MLPDSAPQHPVPPTPAAQVLIVEDEPEHAEVMAAALRRPGHVCTIVNSVQAALDELAHGSFDVIVTDLRMPESAGFETPGGFCVSSDGGDAGQIVLREAKRLQPHAEAVMVTAHGDVPTARAAFKDGAFDFIEKPLDLEVFRSVLNRAAEVVLLRHESPEAEGLIQHNGFEGIIAGSEPMRRILHTVTTIAPSSIPVLITGESGTGKELIARALHDHSKRAQRRFVAFNCAGQAESLLEDELFGHVRGAFTGADKEREGVFEYADKGTLFLDEIGDMPMPMQAKLLRVLETGELVRLGSNTHRSTDVRFVSATNQDLPALVKQGRFREDLYFRINGSHIQLPPLRDRREDIPRIVRHAIARFAEDLVPGTPVPGITDAALMRLTAFDWPGNVRQLLNVVQNMTVTAFGESGGKSVQLETQHIPEDIRAEEHHAQPRDSSGMGSLAGTSLEQLEKRAIRETLKLTGGNREQTAKLLGIGERTLYRKLKEYGLR